MGPETVTFLLLCLVMGAVSGSWVMLLGGLIHWITRQPPQIEGPKPYIPPPPPPPMRAVPPPPEPDHGALLRDEIDQVWEGTPSTVRDTVESLARHIRFTGNRVFLGYEKTGQRELGVHAVECPYPADTVDVRPIRDLGEVPNLLATETLLDDDLFDARLASGEALVQTHQKFEPYFEDVYEPAFSDHVEIIYVLLDVSPSMYNEAWRIPIWTALAARLLQKAALAEAPFFMREFSSQCGPLWKVVTPKGSRKLLRHIRHMPMGNGTDITRALVSAINDFRKQDYDSADIMIITDGEDAGMDADALRKALDDAQIKVHAIMLGVENASLRQCVDTYQIVEPVEGSLVLHPPVRRAGNLRLRK